MKMKHIGALALVAAFFVSAAPARAEIVFFSSGRTLSVKSHHLDGGSLVLALRNGGEILCDPSIVARIAPDEVPYPEPEEATNAAAPSVPNAAAALNAARYAALIERVSVEQGVSSKLVRAVIQVESAYRESARSPKGAMGLMQLMPKTARQYSLTNPYDPAANIEAGIRHLKSLLGRFTLPLALAAYNAGEGAVRRFGGVPPYPETRAYVSRVLKLLG